MMPLRRKLSKDFRRGKPLSVGSTLSGHAELHRAQLRFCFATFNMFETSLSLSKRYQTSHLKLLFCHYCIADPNIWMIYLKD